MELEKLRPIYELEVLQKVKGWNRFTYMTENQDERGDELSSYPTLVKMRFPKMSVREFTHQITFYDGERPVDGNYLALSGVEGFAIRRDILGDLLIIVTRFGRFVIWAQS